MARNAVVRDYRSIERLRVMLEAARISLVECFNKEKIGKMRRKKKNILKRRIKQKEMKNKKKNLAI